MEAQRTMEKRRGLESVTEPTRSSYVINQILKETGPIGIQNSSSQIAYQTHNIDIPCFPPDAGYKLSLRFRPERGLNTTKPSENSALASLFMHNSSVCPERGEIVFGGSRERSAGERAMFPVSLLKHNGAGEVQMEKCLSGGKVCVCDGREIRKSIQGSCLYTSLYL